MNNGQLAVNKNIYIGKRLNIKNFLQYATLIFISAIVILPILTLVIASLKTPGEISQGQPFALPEMLYIGNFETVFSEANIPLALKNSFILGVVSVVFNIILGSITAYTLSRYNFKLRKVIMALFLFAMILPFYTTEIARFNIIKSLGLYNTLMAPLIIYIGTDMMQIFIFTQYIEKIPYSLEESAMVEGASTIYIFVRIIFPMLLPASATLGIIKFVEVINDMYIPYLYMPSSRLATLSTSLMTFAGSRTMDWGKLSAVIVIVMIPTLVVYTAFQKLIIDGITAGSVKE